MFLRHHTDKLIYPLVFALVLMIASYRPKYHLRTEMPSGFFAASTSESAQKRNLEKKIAWAYWESAQMNVQWKYAYGRPLPPDAPAEFSIDAKALGPGAADPALRALYWRRLQQVWPLPETWKKDYGWDWSWVGDPLASGTQWMRDSWDRWFSMHGPR
jgi:hypothetical protein